VTATCLIMFRSQRASPALASAVLLTILAILVIWLLWPALTTVPFWDDLYTPLAIDDAASRGRPSFAATGRLTFWRPLELVINSVLRPLDPVHYLPVKLIAVGCHVLKVIAVVLLVSRLVRRQQVAPLIIGAVALFHPAAVSAVVQIDTVSESIAAASIAWALLLTLQAVEEETGARRLILSVVVILCAVAVLGKESAVPAVAAIPIVGFIAASDRRRVTGDLAALTAILAAVGIGYLLVRHGLGFSRPISDGRYDIAFGPNVAQNIATVAGSLVYFGNTVSLLGGRNAGALVGFVPFLMMAAVIAVALVRRPHEVLSLLNLRPIAACLVMALAATIAPSLAPMISEHNAALTSVALLAPVFALINAVVRVSGPPVERSALVLAGFAILLGALSIREKGRCSRDRGAYRRSGALDAGSTGRTAG
jgi:hypothetical protein